MKAHFPLKHNKTH